MIKISKERLELQLEVDAIDGNAHQGEKTWCQHARASSSCFEAFP
jgi:hypothetical protein